MSKLSIDESTLVAIGDAIREKTEGSDKIAPLDMPAAIKEIKGGADPIIEELKITSNGTYTASEGVDGYSPITVEVPTEDTFEDFLANNLTEITYNGTSLTAYGIAGKTKLKKVSLPNLTTISNYCFFGDSQLTSVEMPKVTELRGCVFAYCSVLKELDLSKIQKISGSQPFLSTLLSSIELPMAYSVYGNVGYYCTKLINLGLPAAMNSGSGSSYWNYRPVPSGSSVPFECLGIRDCTSLPGTSTSYALISGSAPKWKIFIIDNETPPTLASITGTFYSQTIANQLTIYVPKSAVETYQTATNWSSMNIAAIEDNEGILLGRFNWIDEKYFSEEKPLSERWKLFASSGNFAYLDWDELKLVSDDLKANGSSSEFYDSIPEIGFSWSSKGIIFTLIDTFKDLDENGEKIPFTLSITQNNWSSGSPLHFITSKMNETNTNTGGWGASYARTQMQDYIGLTVSDKFKAAITPHQKKYVSRGDSKESICIDNYSLFGAKQIYADGYSKQEGKGINTETQYQLFANNNVNTSNYSYLKSNNFWWLSDSCSGDSNRFCYINPDGIVYSNNASYAYGFVGYITI